jgi:UDP-glucose 4-epimerase
LGEEKMKKVILVTGALGFLGRHVTSFLKEKNYFIIGIDHENCKKYIKNNLGIDKLINKDVSFKIIKSLNYKIDYIVHCAGSSSVGNSIEKPYLAFKDTVESTCEILEYMRTVNPDSKLIYPSSVAVYGDKADRPIKEIDELSPVSPYGCFKKIVEELCETYSDIYGLNISIIRFFSIYGIYLKKQLLWDACTKFSSNKNNIYFFGTGEETRDWIHIKDALTLITLIMRDKQKGFFVVNGASGRKIKNRELITEIAKYFNKNQKDFSFIQKNKIGDPMYYHADITKALNLGWKPKVLLENGIRDYILWFKGENDKNSIL